MTAGDLPYLYPKFILAALPAAYAWQVYGSITGVAVYVIVDVLLVALGWVSLLRDWSFRRLVWTRTSLLILSLILIGLSAAESCDSNWVCHKWWR
jgi:hypothetical protein